MNRNQFLRKLARQLKKLPQEEKEAALRYYREYFDEAGAENEQRVLEELGSPEKVAAEVFAGSSLSDSCGVAQTAQKGGIGVVGTVILSILAAPVALPLAIAAVCIVVALAAVILALILAFIAGAISVAAAGAILFSAFHAFFFSSFGMGCLSVGALLFTIAVFILLLALTIWLGRLIFRGFSKLFSKSGRKIQNEQNG